jgi:hypothetical protein
MANRSYQMRRSTLEHRNRSAIKRRSVRKQSVFKNIILVVIGLAIGCVIGPKTTVATPSPTELLPQPMYRVIFGPAELEELQRRIQEMQYLYTQATTMKKMIETKDWLGIGRSIGDPKLTGLLDALEPAIKSGKEALQDIKALNPRTYLSRDSFSSGEDYISALSKAVESSKTAKQNILTLMNERYADTIIDSQGLLKTKHTQGSLPYFASYQRDALDAIQTTMAQMVTEEEGSLAQLMHINNQILLNQGVMMTHLLEAIADQNRILTIMAGSNIEVMQ